MEQVLNKLPKGWINVQVKDVTKSLSSGFACNKSFETTDGYVHLRTHNISTSGCLNFDQIIKVSHEKIDEKKSKIFKGEILFNNTNSKELVGKTAYVDQDYDFAFSNHLTRVVPNDMVHSKFLVYWLVSLQTSGYFNQICKKWIGQAGVNNTVLKGLSVPLPSKEEQKRIVVKLDALLTRIDTAIEHLQESVTLADALYASTINEQMMQAIELAGLSTVEKHIEQIQTGTTPPTKQPEFYENGDINWFAPSDFGDHDILFDSNKKLSQKAFDAGKARKFDAGTIMLVAIGATIGKIGYLEQDASSNQQITGMKFNSAIIPRYAYYWFRFIKPEILTNASTATLPIINQKGIKALSFCAPNKQLQETICKKIDEVSNFRNTVKAELNEKVELMRSLKASILDSAFKGEL